MAADPPALSVADLYEAYRGVMDRVVQGVCRHPSLAHDERADLAQDLYTAFFQNDARILRAFRGSSELETYLFAVALGMRAKWLRSRRKVALREITGADLDRVCQSQAVMAIPERSEPTRIRLWLTVRRYMDERDCQLLMNRYLSSRSIAGMAAAQGVSQNTMAHRIYRAVQRARELVHRAEESGGREGGRERESLGPSSRDSARRSNHQFL